MKSGPPIHSGLPIVSREWSAPSDRLAYPRTILVTAPMQTEAAPFAIGLFVGRVLFLELGWTRPGNSDSYLAPE